MVDICQINGLFRDMRFADKSVNALTQEIKRIHTLINKLWLHEEWR